RDAASGGVYELSRLGRDARQALEKIQCYSLCGKKRVRIARDSRDDLIRRAQLAVPLERLRQDVRIELTEGLECDLESGNYARLLDEERASSPLLLRHDGFRRDVPGADVFGERLTDQLAVRFRIERPHNQATGWSYPTTRIDRTSPPTRSKIFTRSAARRSASTLCIRRRLSWPAVTVTPVIGTFSGC